LSQGEGESKGMNKMKSIVMAMVLVGSVGWAGDGLYEESGSYAGTVSRTFWQTETGSYGGSVFANGCLSDRSGRYAGSINANGSITRADGSYGGFVSGWKADEGE